MEQLFYSTGQVARQLGITLATVRLLCENGVIAAETTPGGHLRIPESEVKRLKRDGLPPIPRPLPTANAPAARNMPARLQEHSDSPAELSEVQFAQDLVAITRSMLEKRRIDRDREETEDWFRARQRQTAAEEAIERYRGLMADPPGGGAGKAASRGTGMPARQNPRQRQRASDLQIRCARA